MLSSVPVFSVISPEIATFFIVGFISLIYYVARRFDRNKELRKGHPSLPLRFADVLGHLKYLPNGPKHRKLHPRGVYFMQLFTGYAKLFQKEKYFCLWMSYTPFFILNKAEAVEELLGSTKNLDKAWLYNILHPWLGTGLLTSKRQKWKARRKILTPAFHFDILKDFLPVLNKQSQTLIDILRQEKDNAWIDLVHRITLCSLDIICESTLGVAVDAQRNSDSEYVQAVLRAANTTMTRMTSPQLWPNWIFNLLPIGKQFSKDVSILHNFTRKVIRKKKKEIISSTEDNIQNYDNQRKALLERLIEYQLKYGDISEDDIQEEVDTFAFEGHDTTSMAISWTLYLLGLHPKVQTKVQRELDDLFCGSNCDITKDDITSMKYLNQVMKESLRLFPSVPSFLREIDEGMTLDGKPLPKGGVYSVFPYMLHRDPDVFPNPDIFDPDRFLPEAVKGRHPYAYIPFSAGPRNCIGQRFATMEIKTVVATVLRTFTIESLEPLDKIHVVPDLILRSVYPLKVKLFVRQ